MRPAAKELEGKTIATAAKSAPKKKLAKNTKVSAKAKAKAKMTDKSKNGPVKKTKVSAKAKAKAKMTGKKNGPGKVSAKAKAKAKMTDKKTDQKAKMADKKTKKGGKKQLKSDSGNVYSRAYHAAKRAGKDAAEVGFNFFVKTKGSEDLNSTTKHHWHQARAAGQAALAMV